MYDSSSSPGMPFGNGTGFNQNGNPWFNVANQFTPRNLHDIIRWARYITIQSPTTTEVIRKLATYPITEFSVNTKDDDLKERYRVIFKSLKMKEALQNCGFDFFSLGNVFVSIYLPIMRELVCPQCRTRYNSKKATFLTFKKFSWQGNCQHDGCNYSGAFTREDTKSLNVNDINIIKWTPEHIVVDHNPITGEKEYYYKIPNILKQKILKGDRLAVDSTPWAFIEAVKYNQDFKFDQGSLFHLQNISTSGTVDGVSVPPMLSLFTLVFYQATLRKANEAIATEYLNPLRVVYPQAQTANSDPVMAMSMRNFKSNMEDAIKLHKRDKNYFLVSPVPVGYQAVNGEGKNLLVSQEIAQAEEQILLSLGVSQELLSGTTNWTSTSVGLRMMENTLFSYVSRIEDLLTWAMDRVASYLNMEKVDISLIPFKLLDDSNYQSLLLQLVQNNKASYTTLFEELGLDLNKENDNIVEEGATAASQQVELKYKSEQAQFMAATKASDDIKLDDGFQLAMQKAQATTEQLATLDPGVQAQYLNKLKVVDYAQWWMVSQMLQSNQAPGVEAGGDGDSAQGQGQPVSQDQEQDSDGSTQRDSDPTKAAKTKNGPGAPKTPTQNQPK